MFSLSLEKTGYTGKSGQEWNTSSDGTGTSYSQATTTYDANTFGGADLSTGDQVVTLYVNWVPVNYEIQYDLQGGTLATSNPATYNIETTKLKVQYHFYCCHHIVRSRVLVCRNHPMNHMRLC